jgi:hypothetical protein
MESFHSKTCECPVCRLLLTASLRIHYFVANLHESDTVIIFFPNGYENYLYFQIKHSYKKRHYCIITLTKVQNYNGSRLAAAFVTEGSNQTYNNKLNVNSIILTPAAMKINGGSVSSSFFHTLLLVIIR